MRKSILLLVLSWCLVPLFFTGVRAQRAADPGTVITGDEMEITKGGKIVTFRGKAKVTRGENTLAADVLVQNKETGIVEAHGSVTMKTFSPDRELILARADHARYHMEKEEGELWDGRPRVTYHVKAATAPVVLEADRIAIDRENEVITAKGSVEIISSSACAYAPGALFRHREKKLILTGPEPQPKIVYTAVNERTGEPERSEYTADIITLLTDTRQVLLEGNVHGTMNSDHLRQPGTSPR